MNSIQPLIYHQEIWMVIIQMLHTISLICCHKLTLTISFVTMFGPIFKVSMRLLAIPNYRDIAVLHPLGKPVLPHCLDSEVLIKLLVFLLMVSCSSQAHLNMVMMPSLLKLGELINLLKTSLQIFVLELRNLPTLTDIICSPLVFMIHQ